MVWLAWFCVEIKFLPNYGGLLKSLDEGMECMHLLVVVSANWLLLVVSGLLLVASGGWMFCCTLRKLPLLFYRVKNDFNCVLTVLRLRGKLWLCGCYFFCEGAAGFFGSTWIVRFALGNSSFNSFSKWSVSSCASLTLSEPSTDK